MFCRSCGREVTGKPQFCPWCGQTIGGESDPSEPRQNRYDSSDNQAAGQDGRRSVTMEDIERYAPLASLAPVVMALLSLVFLVPRSFGVMGVYTTMFLLLMLPSGIISLVICCGTLAAAIGLFRVAIKKKDTSNGQVWVAPIVTLVAFISCLLYLVSCFTGISPALAFILGLISSVIGLELVARITISGQPMESPMNPGEAVAVYQNFRDQSQTVKGSLYSYFDGSGFEYLGYILLTALVSAVTCGIAAPWMICAKYKWKLSHTVINGRRFTFDGTGAGLLGHWIVWEILTVITCGIYAFFAHVALRKWELSHTYIDGEPVTPGAQVSYFDGNSFQYFGYRLMGGLFIGLTCGLATPWVMCMMQGWDIKHQIVNTHRLEFDGSGVGFLGEYIIIALLSFITCGIYLPWGIVRQIKYVTSHTFFA